jgi:hypothetical protein
MLFCQLAPLVFHDSSNHADIEFWFIFLLMFSLSKTLHQIMNALFAVLIFR